MAQKMVEIAGLGEIVLAKRRGSKSLRLSVSPSGKIRVGMPTWLPYTAGIKFAVNKTDWIKAHQQKLQIPGLKSGDLIGKSHRILFVQDLNANKTTTRLRANEIIIRTQLPFDNVTVQRTANRAAERALKKQAEHLLPIRLKSLANKHGFVYKLLLIKRLQSRWGSCSNQSVITLNYFLIQLPWHLVDYVILHELIHTQHLNHSREFWQTFEQVEANVKSLKKEIKDYRPAIMIS